MGQNTYGVIAKVAEVAVAVEKEIVAEVKKIEAAVKRDVDAVEAAIREEIRKIEGKPAVDPVETKPDAPVDPAPGAETKLE